MTATFVPDELLIETFSFLSRDAIERTEVTNKRWHRLIQNNEKHLPLRKISCFSIGWKLSKRCHDRREENDDDLKISECFCVPEARIIQGVTKLQHVFYFCRKSPKLSF